MARNRKRAQLNSTFFSTSMASGVGIRGTDVSAEAMYFCKLTSEAGEDDNPCMEPWRREESRLDMLVVRVRKARPGRAARQAPARRRTEMSLGMLVSE